VTTATRSAELPQVPTLAEAGVAGFEMSTWYGMFVTSGTPPAVTARLQTELAKILKLPDVQATPQGPGRRARQFVAGTVRADEPGPVWLAQPCA
jgi:tripartite-type tricarboxylate transporter receptor subunit TctC